MSKLPILVSIIIEELIQQLLNHHPLLLNVLFFNFSRWAGNGSHVMCYWYLALCEWVGESTYCTLGLMNTTEYQPYQPVPVSGASDTFS